VQDTLNIDLLFDGDVDIEESAVDNNANHQEISAQEHEDLQAASLMIQTTTFYLGEE